MKKTAFIIILCLIAASMAAQTSSEAPRTIVVSGSAEVSVDIDYVQVTFSVLKRDKSFEKAQTDNIKVVDQVIKELSSPKYGIAAADIYTENYSLAEYSDQKADGSYVKAGYAATTQMRVKLRNTAAYRDILLALLKLGVNGIDNVSYVPKALGPYKLEALGKAFDMARQKATLLAAAAGTSIIGVQSVSENSSYNSPVYGQQNVAQAFSTNYETSGNSGGISVGDRTLTAEVTVVFLIK